MLPGGWSTDSTALFLYRMYISHLPSEPTFLCQKQCYRSHAWRWIRVGMEWKLAIKPTSLDYCLCHSDVKRANHSSYFVWIPFIHFMFMLISTNIVRAGFSPWFATNLHRFCLPRPELGSEVGSPLRQSSAICHRLILRNLSKWKSNMAGPGTFESVGEEKVGDWL